MLAQLRLRLLQALAVGFLLFLWWLATATGLVAPTVIPPVTDVGAQLAESSQTTRLWTAALTTVASAAAGLGLAIAAGIPLGLVIGAHPHVDRMTRFLVDLGRSFPVIALLPVMILLLGATPRMKLVVVFLACVWPILIQSLYGARRLDPVIVDTVRSYRIPRMLRFRRVVLPSAGPFIATGIRVAAAGAVLVSVGVEVLSQTPGLGRQITLAQRGGASATALVYVLYAGLLGLLLNSGLWACEQRLLRWQRRDGAG